MCKEFAIVIFSGSTTLEAIQLSAVMCLCLCGS